MRSSSAASPSVAATLLGVFLALGGGSCQRDTSPNNAHRVATAVVLIIVDTLRADHLGAYGYARPTSPHVDEWARSGRLFERAFATSPWTLPSFGSIYTGYLPTRHSAGAVALRNGRKPYAVFGAESFGRLDQSIRTLAEILAGEGYATGAVINNAYLSSAFGVDRGFGTYDYEAGTGKKSRLADATVDRALAWIDEHRNEPFFLVVHIFDPHMSYDPPPPFRGRFSARYASKLSLPVEDVKGIRSDALELAERDRQFIIAAYDEEVAFVDRELGRLREELEARGLLERGLLILTSDHGEELFDHDGFEHGHALWQELLLVPLVIWGPDVRAGREAAPVSIVDLCPTILEATGNSPPDALEGISLWSHLTEGTPIPERTLYASGTLYGPRRMAAIRWPDKVVISVETDEQFATDLDADPLEERNVAPARPEITKQLLADVRRRVRTNEQKLLQIKLAKPDSETRARLRALGYVE